MKNRERLLAEAMDGLDSDAVNKLVADSTSHDGIITGLIDAALSPGTCQMAIRALQLQGRATPPEIRAAARFFRADWRAVCVLVGWAETAEGEWLDIEADGFSWDQVRPESTTPGAQSPSGERWWNQELAAYAVARSLRRA